MADNPPAWHPDPTGTHDHRWWDGQRWTEHVADAGVASVDPLPAAPPATAATGGEDHGPGTGDGGDAQPGAGPAATAGGVGGTAAGAAAWSSGADTSGQQPAWGTGADTSGQQPAWSAGADASGQQPAWPGTDAGGGAPAWGAAQGAPPAGDPNRTSGLAISALVLGMLAIPSAMVLIGGLFGLVAIILGAVAAGKAKRGETGGRGIAIGGIITGAIGLVIAIGLFITVFGGIASDIQSCIEETGDPELCQREIERDLMERFG